MMMIMKVTKLFHHAVRADVKPWQLIISRGGRFRRESPEVYMRNQQSEWKTKHKNQPEKKAGKPKISHHVLFCNERNLFFAKCFILAHAQEETKYYPTVKEIYSSYKGLYPEGIANKKTIECSGVTVRVRFNIDPTFPKDMHKIKKMPKRQKFDCIYYIDSTGEDNMKNFFIMCSSVLKNGGEIHMILKETDFLSLNLQDLAASVNIYIKKVEKFHERYCEGYSPTHVNAAEARIYIFELDETKKATKSNNEERVTKTLSSSADNHNADASVLPPQLVESGLLSEVNASVGEWNMMYLNMINGGTVNFWTVINFVINPQPLVPTRSAMSHNIEKALVDLQIQSKAQLARVALPETKGTYPRIQWVCETELGLLSQNVKAGGRNRVLSATPNGRLPYVTDLPNIIVGTHPQIGDDSSPATVVASMDWPQMTKYKALVSAQPHQQEIMQDYLYMPKRGVIHGGLIREFLPNDKGMIRKVCISLEMPPATFVLPGFCSRQGTSHPTRNHAENKFTADGLQMLTNSSCYMYARSTSDSIVQRAYYAHPAAFRGLSYMEGDQLDSDSPGQRATTDRVAEVRSLPLLHDN